MKFRLISSHGDGLALAYRISEEDNKVDFWVKDKEAKPSYAGLLPQVDDWRSGLTKDTIIIFDMVGMGKIADGLRKKGHLVYGGSALCDRLELDREFAMRVAKISGVRVPKYKGLHIFRHGGQVCRVLR